MSDSPEPADSSPVISVVVPFYNEEDNVHELHRRLDRALRSLGVPYEILFVDDGSRDETPARMDALRATDLCPRRS
jgi:polyisoprenyl-phosphate glycosyltransferase